MIVEGNMPLEEDRFAEEKLSPVLTIWRYGTFDEAYEILERLTDNCGTGHSCGIYTQTNAYVEQLGLNMRTSRILVNQPQAPGNGGNFCNGMPSTVTLGCGTWGGNITTENITYKHFLNITWVSELISVEIPTDEEIFGAWWAKAGKQGETVWIPEDLTYIQLSALSSDCLSYEGKTPKGEAVYFSKEDCERAIIQTIFHDLLNQ